MNAAAQQARQPSARMAQMNQKEMVTAKYEAGKYDWQAAAAPLKPRERVQKNCQMPARPHARKMIPRNGNFDISPSGEFSLLQKIGRFGNMPMITKIRLIMQ